MSQVFKTTDVNLAAQILHDNYGGNICIDAGSSFDSLRLEATVITPSARLDQITFGLSFHVQADALGRLVVCRMSSGGLAYHPAGGVATAYGPGDAFIPIRPERGFTADCAEADFRTTVLDPVLLGSVAETAPGRRPEPVRFTSHQPSPQPPPRGGTRCTDTPARRSTSGWPASRCWPGAWPGCWPPPP
ncbi:hypothetical protein [Micromonospora sp. DT227]|uniref:hypothetical protein n=1 Tax=Micromonospora sp. DT227 TaxID=3393433 RepID=UPI003CEFF52C